MFPTRSAAWSELSRGEFDLVVIGAGINGSGIAYDAALNGLRTLLVDKDDIGSGTTAWSSRLIHGGLRYLDGLELSLVRESLRERSHLLRIASHLVEPLELTIPVYTSNRHRLWKVRIGLTLYDWMSHGDGLPAHRRFRPDEISTSCRSLRQEDLEGAVSYFDARAEFAERLCLDVAAAASQAGAVVLTHTEIIGLQLASGRVTRLSLSDRLGGSAAELEIGADSEVFNAAGPWVDEVLGRVRAQGRSSGMRRRIGGVKGSHLLVDRFEGAPDSGMYVEASSDGRPYFILPWYRRLLIGTTERRFESDPSAASADADEIDYLLSETNRVFPRASLAREDVRLAYAGVRALPFETSKRLGRITRRHLLVDHSNEGAANLCSLVGGKLTTFRAVAEEVVDRILARRVRRRVATTANALLPGAWSDTSARDEAERSAASVIGNRASRLLTRMYGAHTMELLDRMDRDPSLAEPVAQGLDDRRIQIHWARDRENALRLTDLLVRRWLLPMRRPELLTGLQARDPSPESLSADSPLLSAVSDEVARVFGWSQVRRNQEVMGFVDYARAHLIPSYRLRRG